MTLLTRRSMTSFSFFIFYRYLLIHARASFSFEKILNGYVGGLKLKKRFATIRLKGDEEIIASAAVILLICSAIKSRCSFAGEVERAASAIRQTFLLPMNFFIF